jgi:hypothetical protein
MEWWGVCSQQQEQHMQRAWDRKLVYCRRLPQRARWGEFGTGSQRSGGRGKGRSDRPLGLQGSPEDPGLPFRT